MTDREPASKVPVHPAATVMLLRDGVGSGLEVFMLQRTLSASFARGSFVFPGGRVDDADDRLDFSAVCDDLDDAAASERLGVAAGGLAWYVAAIRECFEEAGVLLARRTTSGETDAVRFDEPTIIERFNAARERVHTGELSLVELCHQEDLTLLPGTMQFVAHWVTPLGERRRFDTRFFVAPAPAAQTPLHDDNETIASLWVRPADALAMYDAGELQMLPPTVTCLRMLEPWPTVSDAMSALAAIDRPRPVLPKLVLTPDEHVAGVVLPDSPAYETTSDPEFVVLNPR